MQAGKPLCGQVAAVTGAGRGIGKATALALAGQGAAVAVMARSGDEIAATAAAIEADQGRALAVRVDITDAEAVRGAFARVAGELGEVDLLVNNAGRNTVFGPVGDVDPAQWWDDIGTNLLGPVLCTAAVLPAMRPAQPRPGHQRRVRGRWKAESQQLGLRLRQGCPGQLHRIGRRGGGLTGVAVFAFAPGPIRTRLMADLTGDPLANGGTWRTCSVANPPAGRRAGSRDSDPGVRCGRPPVGLLRRFARRSGRPLRTRGRDRGRRPLQAPHPQAGMVNRR